MRIESLAGKFLNTKSKRAEFVEGYFPFEDNIESSEEKMTEEENKENSPKRLRLGEILVKKGILSESDLAKVLKEQKSTGEPLGEILINRH